MSNSISRQEAINAFDIFTAYEANRTNEDWVKRIKIVLSSLPSTEMTGWIPIEDGLPKSSGVYIVSRWFSDGFEEAILTDACYFDGTSTWHDDNRINHGREYVDKKIVAWMPLPQPYRAEGSGE